MSMRTGKTPGKIAVVQLRFPFVSIDIIRCDGCMAQGAKDPPGISTSSDGLSIRPWIVRWWSGQISPALISHILAACSDYVARSSTQCGDTLVERTECSTLLLMELEADDSSTPSSTGSPNKCVKREKDTKLDLDKVRD